MVPSASTTRPTDGTELDTGATRANSKVADFLFYGICGGTSKPAFKDERARVTAGAVIKPIGARAVGKVVNDDRADWREAWALFPGAVAYIWHAGNPVWPGAGPWLIASFVSSTAHSAGSGPGRCPRRADLNTAESQQIRR